MSLIPRRFSHVVFGALQSGLTSAIASGIASAPFWGDSGFFQHWVSSWLYAWLVMLPIVMVAAPWLRRLALALTYEDA